MRSTDHTRCGESLDRRCVAEAEAAGERAPHERWTGRRQQSPSHSAARRPCSTRVAAMNSFTDQLRSTALCSTSQIV